MTEVVEDFGSSADADTHRATVQPVVGDRWSDLEALYAAASPGPWEAGHHPAIPTGGAIIRPVTFGSRVRVLPEHEGGHVMIGEADAAFIAAVHADLPALLAAARFARLRPGSVSEYVAEYEFRGEADYTPTDDERTMIEDAIHGFIEATTAPEAGAAGTTEGREPKIDTTREGADR